MRHVVVVGASLAGLRAVEALRRRGYAGSITLVGSEAEAPYDRPPLSKQVLIGDWEPERAFFRQREGYGPLDVDLRTGVAATGLALEDNRLWLSDGACLPFDGLVIATGARARLLPNTGGLAGVHTLRTLDDARHLRADLETAARVVVIGAGFIGLEVASACRARGLPVTVVELAAVPLASILGRTMGEAITGLHRAQGVQFRTGVGVLGLAGHRRVHSVELQDGSQLPADVVVVGIGVQPNVEWLDDSGVRVDDGVMCDERCATSRPDVVAAGDVASFQNTRFGVRQRVEHWTHAVEMASAAVGRLLEGPDVAPFVPVPYFWSDQFDVKVQFVGHVQPDDELRLLEGSPDERKLVAVYTRDGRLTGALTWNRPPRLIQLRQAITRGASLAEVLA